MPNVKDVTRDKWILSTFPEWGTWLNEEIEDTKVEKGTFAMWWLGCTGLWVKTENDTNIIMDYWCGSGKQTHYNADGTKKKISPDHQMARMSGCTELQPNLRLVPAVLDPFAIKKVDAVLASHTHTDHIDINLAAAVLNNCDPDVPFIGSKFATDKWREWGVPEERLHTVKPGDVVKVKEYKLISLTGGNISLKIDDDTYLVTPSGMLYEEMVASDICVIDHECNVKEGIRKPSSDSTALIYIFDHMKDVNCVIHTHQPYATAIGLVKDSLPCCMVTLIDATKARVNVAPWTKSQDIGMGKLVVEYAGDACAVIMKHHGVVTYGKDLKEALYSAVYLEEGAKTYCIASMMGKVPELTQEQIDDEASGWSEYGQ